MFTKIFARLGRAVTRCALTAGLMLAAVGTVDAGPRCHKLGQRFAAKRAAASTVKVMPAVGTATVQPVRGVFRAMTAPLKATCVNGICK